MPNADERATYGEYSVLLKHVKQTPSRTGSRTATDTWRRRWLRAPNDADGLLHGEDGDYRRHAEPSIARLVHRRTTSKSINMVVAPTSGTVNCRFSFT